MQALNHPKRIIKTFVLRQGRMTAAQIHAFDAGYKIYGIPLSTEPLNLKSLFSENLQTENSQLVLDIGFGMGDALVEAAKDNLNTCYIGVEMHKPGVGNVLRQIIEQDLKNIRVIREDVNIFLSKYIAPQSLDMVQIFFPDPWPKTRHHKRRLINPAFISLLSSKLKEGGVVHLATDWAPYAQHMLTVLEQGITLDNVAGKFNFSPRPISRPLTKFEKRGIAKGHEIFDLIFKKIKFLSY